MNRETLAYVKKLILECWKKNVSNHCKLYIKHIWNKWLFPCIVLNFFFLSFRLSLIIEIPVYFSLFSCLRSLQLRLATVWERWCSQLAVLSTPSLAGAAEGRASLTTRPERRRPQESLLPKYQTITHYSWRQSWVGWVK